ncbi:MAG: hydroxyacid dehydrogenase, partial [Caldilineaceae bacterium]|nr:hydroxyacid dehydrogenase [Caldilineaceae bacterium]
MNNMIAHRPRILLAFDRRVREQYLDHTDLERLDALANWDWFECEGGGIYSTNDDPATVTALRERIGAYDGVIVCHGAPTLTAEILDAAPNLRFIGELEGDRFATRIDLDAAWARHIRTVDTTNASSYPVAEWALGLILVCMRNAGEHFRRIIAGNTRINPDARSRMPGRLTGKRVGLIGGGHMGRRLIKLLRPFDVDIWVHDPYLPRELPEALGVTATSLQNVLSQCDVIVCLVPLTPQTKGMLGANEIEMIRSGAVFVNVSRGPVVDADALVARLRRGDILAGLDVFDPEPIPADSDILHLPNVFLSPHIGYYTGDQHPHFFNLMVDEVERFFHGHETYYDLTPRSKANRSDLRFSIDD